MYDRPFRWWVHSVMPVVFDDSLSYYEVLAKLTKYIEGLTGDVDQIEKVLETIEGIEDVTQFTEMLESIKNEIGNLGNLSTQNKTDLVSAINEIALKADTAYYKPPTGIPESDLSQRVQDKLNRTVDATKYIINNRELKTAPNNNSPADLGLGTYSVPDGGIPWDTLSEDVQHRIESGSGGEGGTKDYTDLNNKPQINGHTLNAGNNSAESLGLGTYSKPNTGIPENDLSAEVQEKLNTSGGIADSETSFIATRDYEAGELIYINGVLYKTKYRILSGTNLIPGNNIEVTDISAEIERINNDIDSLQSESGPDSWNLKTDVTNNSATIYARFFEYFNAIGGENYLFIITPGTNNAFYQLKISKKDDSWEHYENINTAPNEQNQYRFTFTPTDTGEYYCAVRKWDDGDARNVNISVSLEYTQSQGISELWSKVNEASQLEPRVGALETLVGEQQTQLEELDDIPERVVTLENNTSELSNAINDYPTPIGDMIPNTLINSRSGAAVESPDSDCTNFIRVVPGEKLYIYNAYLKNNRSIYGYAQDEAPVEVLAANMGSTSNVVVTIPNTVAYIRITCRKNQTPIIKVANDYLFNLLLNVRDKILYIDDFAGSDSTKLRDAIRALSSTGGTICITRPLYIDTNIKVTNATNTSKALITLLGVGMNPILHMQGHSFYSDSNATGDNGGLRLMNLTITGDGSGKIFNCTNHLIRIYCNNVLFKECEQVFYTNNEISENIYFQTIYCTNCYFTDISNAVIYVGNDAYDIRFAECECENSASFFVHSTTSPGETNMASVSITNCLIEGCSSTAIALGTCMSVLISGCYFEGNDGGDIDMTTSRYSRCVSIRNNLSFVETGKAFVLLPKFSAQGSKPLGEIANNVIRGNGYFLQYEYETADTLYIDIYSNNYATKYTPNSIKPIIVSEMTMTPTMVSFLNSLGSAMNGTWSYTYDTTAENYVFTFTPNE